MTKARVPIDHGCFSNRHKSQRWLVEDNMLDHAYMSSLDVPSIRSTPSCENLSPKNK